MRKRKNEKILRPVHANVGIEVAYRKALRDLIDEMDRSIQYWLAAAWRKNEPVLSQDEVPAMGLQRALRKLTRRWQRRFDRIAEDLARYFAKSVSARSDRALEAILRKGGMSVKFKLTPAMRDVLRAAVAENVGLIKSIPQQYLRDVEGMVMRSVQTGRDLGTLSKEIRARYDVTKKRAALISRDQNNKVNAVLMRVRQLELGVKQAIWLHSGGGKVPRPTHVKMNGKRYDPARGMWDSAELKFIFPGELINCFSGSSQVQFADGVEIAYRRWYRGELITLVTSSDRTVEATPNHPVLTPRGWVAIGLLNDGDDILEIAEKSLFVSNFDVNHGVPTFDELFESFKVVHMSPTIAGSEHFHGDGTDGNVDVVFATRPLQFGAKSLLSQGPFQLDFAKSNNSHLGFGLVDALGFAGREAASHFVGGFSQLLAAFDARFFHANEHCFASVSNSSPSFFDSQVYDISARFIGLGKGQDTGASFVFPTKLTTIVHVNRQKFSGHVYNLQTRDGWYACNGIIAHNCRCVSRSVVPGFT